LPEPAAAAPRADLTFLRRRSRPAAAPPPRATAPPPAPARPIDYSRPDRARTPASPPPATGSLDLSSPATHVDYRRPDRAPAPPAVPPSPAPSSSSLDLSAPARPTAPRSRPPASAGSLDLSAAPTAAAPAPAPSAPHGPALRVRRDVRVGARQQYLLSIAKPTVTLTRAQSGIGQLSIEAVCSPEVGDLRLGAAYQFRSGGSSTVQHADGHRFAPPSSRRPVLVATREEYERISVDLRQVRDIERVGIYAYSESRAELTWGGTLVLSTFGGARVELPLETLDAGRIAMLMSLYNLDGELVIRAEMETVAGDVREAARAYGYDRITWRDDRAPVD
jgi:hypothetical protein